MKFSLVFVAVMLLVASAAANPAITIGGCGCGAQYASELNWAPNAGGLIGLGGLVRGNLIDGGLIGGGLIEDALIGDGLIGGGLVDAGLANGGLIGLDESLIGEGAANLGAGALLNEEVLLARGGPSKVIGGALRPRSILGSPQAPITVTAPSSNIVIPAPRPIRIKSVVSHKPSDINITPTIYAKTKPGHVSVNPVLLKLVKRVYKPAKTVLIQRPVCSAAQPCGLQGCSSCGAY